MRVRLFCAMGGWVGPRLHLLTWCGRFDHLPTDMTHTNTQGHRPRRRLGGLRPGPLRGQGAQGPFNIYTCICDRAYYTYSGVSSHHPKLS